MYKRIDYAFFRLTITMLITLHSVINLKRDNLKGQDFVKTSLVEKVPQTLQSIEFMEFFLSYLENCSIFGRTCQLADPIKTDVGFYSGHTFFSESCPFNLYLHG